MLDETKGSGPNSGTTETKKGPVKIDKAEQKRVQKSQAAYKGNSFKDKVKVVFTQSTNHHAEGDTKMVHPTTAEVFKAKGIAKLAMILLMFAFAFVAPKVVTAQSSAISFTHATDSTITNTEVDTMYATVQAPFNMYTAAAIQIVITTASGTLAGTSKLYVSVDGYKFDTLYSAPGVTASSKYLTLVNQTTNTYTWYLTAPYCNVKKFMIVTGGSTTVSAYTRAKIIIGKP